MRVIRIFDVILQYVFILLFAGSLVAGVFHWQWFILAGAAILCYFIWGMWRLRCPWCRGPIELNELLMGRRRTCHCPACGHEVTVVVKLGKLTPKPGPAFERPAAAEAEDTVEEPWRADQTPRPGPAEDGGVTVRPDASLEEAVEAILGTGEKDTAREGVNKTEGSL